jgi:2-oxoisovalerate dehydrogenase E2 component (dihydrolipoyl transacylase)
MRSGIQDLYVLAPGSGKGGRIERGDVERYLSSGTTPESPSVPVPASSDEGDVIVELGRTRYGMWKAMEKVFSRLYPIRRISILTFLVQSLEIPHFGYTTSFDITELHEKILPVLNRHIPKYYLPESERKASNQLLGMCTTNMYALN